MTGIDSPEAFAATFDVSRETVEKLAAFQALLLRWNARINLIARSDEADIWHRHLADSAQLWSLRPPGARSWLDLGSGGGFPGLVIAVMAGEADPQLAVTLVEADVRKATFLQTAARTLDVPATVRIQRVESLEPQHADVVSARAFAALDPLIALVEKHRRPSGIGLFPRGRTVHKELAGAEALRRFDHRLHPSLTDDRAAVVEIGALAGDRPPA